jgi:hypothetical protein
MTDPVSVHFYGNRIIFVAIFFCLALFALIIYMVRKKLIYENYALVWILLPIALLLFVSNRFILEKIAALAGIYYAPSVLLPVLYILFIFVMLFFTIIISKRDRQIKDITQELGILKNEVLLLKRTQTSSMTDKPGAIK